MNPHLFAREPLRNLPKTVHGGQAWRLEGVEDYSHNLNPFGPPEDIDSIIREAACGIDHYPDDSSAVLKETISKRFGVPVQDIIIGSGSSDIIRMFPNTFLTPKDRVTIPRPSFAEYAQQCRIVGCYVSVIDLERDRNFRIDYDVLKKESENSRAVYICNPNNPTGMIESRDDILSFVEWCSSRDKLVFLDETLLELVPAHDYISCAKYVSDYDNLIVACSLTKSFAIPGIRIGFGFGNESLIGEMDKVRMTWNVGAIEQNVANVLIRDRMDHVRRAADLMSCESKWMHSQLEGIGFPVTESDSYFYFNPLDSMGITGAEFVKRMLRSNIMVRDCTSFGDRFTSFVRFCVKDRKRNESFVKAVQNSMV